MTPLVIFLSLFYSVSIATQMEPPPPPLPPQAVRTHVKHPPLPRREPPQRPRLPRREPEVPPRGPPQRPKQRLVRPKQRTAAVQSPRDVAAQPRKPMPFAIATGDGLFVDIPSDGSDDDGEKYGLQHSPRPELLTFDTLRIETSFELSEQLKRMYFYKQDGLRKVMSVYVLGGKVAFKFDITKFSTTIPDAAAIIVITDVSVHAIKQRINVVIYLSASPQKVRVEINGKKKYDQLFPLKGLRTDFPTFLMYYSQSELIMYPVDIKECWYSKDGGDKEPCDSLVNFQLQFEEAGMGRVMKPIRLRTIKQAP